jgi:hypothetical protein
VEKYSRFVRKTTQHERPQIFTKQFDWLDNDYSKGTNPRDGCDHLAGHGTGRQDIPDAR